MPARQLLAPFPPMVLGPGYQLVFEALDPSTGAAVAGVKVSSISVQGTNLTEPAAEQLTTLYVPQALELEQAG